MKVTLEQITQAIVRHDSNKQILYHLLRHHCKDMSWFESWSAGNECVWPACFWLAELPHKVYRSYLDFKASLEYLDYLVERYLADK